SNSFLGWVGAVNLYCYFLSFPEVQEYDAIEGQSLSVQCPYNTQDYKEVKKAWCRWKGQNRCAVLVNTDGRYYGYQNRAQKGRARIHDDTQKGIVTVTMENLQVDDAGVYWCAHYKPPSFYLIFEVKLAGVLISVPLSPLSPSLLSLPPPRLFQNSTDPKPLSPLS
uniref:Ig-like domain-containing protein n=1 Tax=Gopherus agassizii TaxID=38772 RepID=A0A452GNI1_9SAUR